MSNWIGSFLIQNGEIAEDNKFIFDYSDPYKNFFKRIIIFSQPNSDISHELCAEIVQSIASDFLNQGLSITGRLQKALKNANSRVAKWNQNSLLEHKIRLSITCVVILDNEMIIANSGSNTVAIVEKTQIRAPKVSYVIASEHLGSQNLFQPIFKKLNTDHHDVVIASSNLIEDLALSKFETILKGGTQRALEDLFVESRHLSNVNVCYLSDIDIRPKLAKGTFYLDQKSMQLELNVTDENLDTIFDMPVSKTSHQVNQFSNSINEFNWSPKFLNISKNKFAFLGIFSRLQKKLSLKRYILGSLVLVVFFLFFLQLLLPSISKSIPNNSLETINNKIEKKIIQYDLAIKDENRSMQRSAIYEALFLIEEAALYDSNEKLDFLITKINKLKIEIDNIQIVTESNKLLVFENKFSSQFDPSKIIVRGNMIWILDSASSRIFEYQVYKNQINEVFRGGMLVDDILLGKPVSILYDDYSRKLLILDSKSNLFTSNQNKIIKLKISELKDSSNVVDYSLNNGVIYFLNNFSNTILYLEPPLNDYNNFNVEIKKLLNYEENKNVIGMEFNDKQIIFSQKQLWILEDTLELITCAGIDIELLSINDVAIDPDSNQIFISDPLNNRIVSCNYNGEYLTQWKNSNFFDIVSISFDPNNLSLYVLTSNTVFEIITEQ
ncbi:MAG: hypothetical protein P8J51_00495 [Dehalococcoidia bacterium]|nr:hypothetical protein [Dehalococcoidia bacterium]